MTLPPGVGFVGDAPISCQSEWIEIDVMLGSFLWTVLRDRMIPDGPISLHESFSDSDGAYGQPQMMTVVGHRLGAPLLRLETTWDGNHQCRENESTRYWLPRARLEEAQ